MLPEIPCACCHACSFSFVMEGYLLHFDSSSLSASAILLEGYFEGKHQPNPRQETCLQMIVQCSHLSLALQIASVSSSACIALILENC